jgi:hypothetical protein
VPLKIPEEEELTLKQSPFNESDHKLEQEDMSVGDDTKRVDTHVENILNS